MTLYHGDAAEVLAGLGDQSVDAVITDPPYTERTHAKSRKKLTGSRTHALIEDGITAFGSITEAELEQILEECGRVSKGWVIATLDYRHAVAYDQAPPQGLKTQRVGVWVKKNPTPQLSGDRPAQGWEAIAYMHRSDTRSKWNGGGGARELLSSHTTTRGAPDSKAATNGPRLRAPLH